MGSNESEPSPSSINLHEDNETLAAEAAELARQCEHWEKIFKPRAYSRYGRSCPCGDAADAGTYLIGCDPVRPASHGGERVSLSLTVPSPTHMRSPTAKEKKTKTK
jgi:hypothetical protein